MRICRLSMLVGLAVLVAVPAVEAAVILATAPFPAAAVNSGFVSCAVTNTGTTSTAVSAVMYDRNGVAAASLPSQTLPPNATLLTDSVALATYYPTHCECTVPNALNYRCALHYVNEGSVTVIPGR
jgi:hypothetical protein